VGQAEGSNKERGGERKEISAKVQFKVGVREIRDEGGRESRDEECLRGKKHTRKKILTRGEQHRQGISSRNGFNPGKRVKFQDLTRVNRGTKEEGG